MALPTFDATKHHIGLGPTGSEFGFFIDGGYQRNTQRYGTPAEYGGDRDQLEPSVLARWTQDDFSGGSGQELWGDDAAMFLRSKNLLPALIQRSARTVPPLVKFIDAGAVDAAASLAVFSTGGKQIAVVDSDKIRFYDAETGVKVETVDPSREFFCATHDPGDNRVYVITKDVSDGQKRLARVDVTDGKEDIATFPASLNNNTPKGIETTAGREILAAFEIAGTGQSLWLADLNDARTDADFTRVGRLPGQWRDSLTYNGLTYILLTDGEQVTQVVAWDGSDTLPVCTFPYNFLGRAIAQYGGRLYVCGSGQDITDTARYAELHEITGSSTRLVRSYADDARAGLTVPSIFYEMVVHEGLLFVGGDSGWLMAYDLTRDGVWSEIEIESAATPEPVEARRLLSTREKLLAWCHDPNTLNPESGFYRMATTDADLTAAGVASYEVELESSDFAPEPAREKRLSELQILTRGASGVPTAPTVEYTTDGGDTWTALAVTSTQNGRFRETNVDLRALDTTKVIRFRISLTKTSISYEEFVAFTATFLMLDTGKRSWQFTIYGGESIEQLDGTTLAQDTFEIDDTLWEWMDNKTLLDFTDINGETRKVQLTDIGTSSPYVYTKLADGSREGFLSVVLTEV